MAEGSIHSPSGSMAGWSWKTWLKKQAPDLKKLVSYIGAGIGAALSLVTLPEWAAPWAAPALALVVGFITRLGLDALDYWLTENPG